jgi:hypothetical protein
MGLAFRATPRHRGWRSRLEGDTWPTCYYSGERLIPVTYYWAYDGKSLTFQLRGEDLLTHRRTCYDGQTYTKSE